MDLRERLLCGAAGRPRPLIAVAPGGTRVRLAAERTVRTRGWVEADGPADADLLLVCGHPGPELAAAVERVWAAMPGPRARSQMVRAQGAADLVEVGRRGLADWPAARADVADRLSGMRIDGRPMADRAPDRDGLKLDVLHLPLGPILADWPAGLALRLVVQGDIVQEAESEVFAGSPSVGRDRPFWSESWLRAAGGERVTAGDAARRRAASHLDGLGRLLSVAGWPDAATTARGLRDGLLTGAASSTGIHRFVRRIDRSRTLRWLTDGLGVLDDAVARKHGVPGAAGDVTARWRRWLAETGACVAEFDRDDPLPGQTPAVGPRGLLGIGQAPSATLLDLLPGLVVGSDLAGARLIVASLDPDLDEVTHSDQLGGEPAPTRDGGR